MNKDKNLVFVFFALFCVEVLTKLFTVATALIPSRL